MSGIIIALTILKIYPIAASSIFAYKRQGYVYSIIVASVSIAALFLTAGLQELRMITENTPQYTCFAYGGLRVFLGVANAWIHPIESKVGSFAFDSGVGLTKAGPIPLLTGRLRLFSIALTLVVALGAIYSSSRRAKVILNFVPTLEFRSAHGGIAISCLSIFCFTFILGSNIDYRLVFLLGILAFTLQAYDTTRKASFLIVPVTVIIFLWLSRLSVGLVPFLLYELVDWIFFASGIAWLAVSLGNKGPETSQTLRAISTYPNQQFPHTHKSDNGRRRCGIANQAAARLWNNPCDG
jgi:hypothetical protein